jgi:hypothetical protein
MKARPTMIGRNSIVPSILAAGAVVIVGAKHLFAATVLFCPFDSLDAWTLRSVGAGQAGIVGRDENDRCVEVTAQEGTILISRDLPVDMLRGSRVTVSCLVKTERVVRGAQQSSTAKVHLAVLSQGSVQHYAARLEGDTPWGHQGLTADVPEDAERAVLNLGLESCSGLAQFDRLLIKNDRRGVHPLDISSAVNAGHGQLEIAAFPEGTIECDGVPFRILKEVDHDGSDCIRLKGVDHPDWPASIASSIPVGVGATVIYLLHGTLGGGEKSPTPCAMWTAQFVGGHDSGLSVFEGRQIGAIGQTGDLENWRVAWRGEDQAGQSVTLGVTKWPLYSEEPVLWLSCRAYHGTSPVIVAVTVVEEPPQPEPDLGEYDEMGMPIGEGEGYE